MDWAFLLTKIEISRHEKNIHIHRAINAKQEWLIMFSACDWSVFPGFLLVNWNGDISSGTCPYLPFAVNLLQ
jgi:hypothetical protein